MRRETACLQGNTFDLLVFGGGIYGAWIAYDAALRGLKVALVEQEDWASATSSASSKLVHGGLRYLETLDLKVVKKSLAEREMLLQTAPHRVWPLRFGVPVYANSRVGALRLKAGLLLYDFLAGNRGCAMAHRQYGRAEFSGRFPLLAAEGMNSGFTYADAQTDDARLVLELVDGAISQGAACANYCRLVRILEQDGKATGALVQDRVSGAEFRVSARQFVNATGYWMAREADGRCRLTKGVHLVLPSAGLDEALLLTAKSDGRVFFIIPWYGRTLLGTTDTDYRGDPEHVSVETEDIAYLLAAANGYLRKGWSSADVIGSFSGLRALRYTDVATPSAISRDWKLEIAPNGVHYSIGGKLTSAREDAGRVVDSIARRLGLNKDCQTGGRLFPWAPAGQAALIKLEETAHRSGLDTDCARWVVRRHGRRAADILNMIAEDDSLAQRIVPDIPLTYADLLFCARTEMVVHLQDLLRRRMPLLILARLEVGDLQRLAARVAPVLGWNHADVAREVESCASLLH